MQINELIGATKPKIIDYNNDYWVCKSDFRDTYYSYNVNFSEYLSYFLLKKYNIDIPDNIVLPINNSNYNLVKYVPNSVEYRSLSIEERKKVIEQFKEKLILLTTINLIVGNDDIHASNFLVDKETNDLYPIDFSNTFLSKISSGKDDGNIDEQIYKRISCTLLNEMLSYCSFEESDFTNAKNKINEISVDEFYKEVENANELFKCHLTTKQKYQIMDRFLNANLYIGAISLFIKPEEKVK